jgi:hypothetical protein
MLVFKLAALVELILVILESSGYVHLRGLPLGGWDTLLTRKERAE